MFSTKSLLAHEALIGPVGPGANPAPAAGRRPFPGRQPHIRTRRGFATARASALAVDLLMAWQIGATSAGYASETGVINA